MLASGRSPAVGQARAARAPPPRRRSAASNILGVGPAPARRSRSRDRHGAGAARARSCAPACRGRCWSRAGPNQIEPRALAFADRLVSDAAAAGIGVIMLVDSTPCWASSAPTRCWRRCMPGRSQQGQRLAAERSRELRRVRRLSGAHATARDWRRSKSGTSPTRPTKTTSPGPKKPQRYAAILRAAYPAIKRADPNVPVLAGSLVGSNGVFLRALYAAGIKGYYDGLSVHFYNADPRLAALDPRSAVRQRRHTPLWLDEFGWSSCWPRQRSSRNRHA